MERKSAMSRALSLVRFHGLPFIWWTVTPYEVDSVVVLRLATIGTATPYEASAPLPAFATRSQLAVDNPVAVAASFKRTIEALLEHLLGLLPNHLRLHSVPLQQRPVGVFGRTIGYLCVIERQARGRPHLHGILFGDVSPAIARLALEDFDLKREVCRFYDSIVRASVPPAAAESSVPAMSTLPCAEPTKWCRDARNIVPTPVADPVGFRDGVNALVRATNAHTHTETCHKGSAGRYRCRLDYPRALWNRATDLLMLVLDPTTGKAVAFVDIDPRDDIDAKIASVDPLLSMRDKRVVIVELRRANDDSPAHEAADGMWCDIALGAEDGSCK